MANFPTSRLPGFPTSYFTKPLLTILFLGFSSGLPLALTGATLTAWLHDAKVDIAVIGLFAAVRTPYALKFFWAPIIDSVPVPLLSRALGRRRGWLLATQAFTALAIAALAFFPPTVNPWATAVFALITAFASASQDIVIDAYRIDRLKPHEQGEGAAMAQLGYRMGMLASGAGALWLANSMPWGLTYLIMAALIGIGMATTLLATEPENSAPAMSERRTAGDWFRDAVIAPFTNFMQHPSWWLILLFIVIYKLADAFIGGMANPFLLEIGFTKAQIAVIVKSYGLIPTLVGILTGGWLCGRFGTIRVLFLSGLLHALTNLCYAWQAHIGADSSFLALSVALENLTGGISSAAFVAYLSNLCNVHYTATQYALLSSLAAFGTTWLSTLAGYAEKLMGWSAFFCFSALLAVPGLLLLLVLKKRLRGEAEI